MAAATSALTTLLSLSQGCAGDDTEAGAASGDAGATASPFGPNADADTGAASGDPGAPTSSYGPKADAHLIVAQHEVGYVNFTAVASKQASLAHLYAIPGEVTNPLVSDYYYLRGTMEMTVPSAQSGQPPLRVAMNINAP